MSSFMETMKFKINEHTTEISNFLRNYSNIVDYNQVQSTIAFLGPAGYFSELSLEAKVHQNNLRKKIFKTIDILSIIFKDISEEHIKTFNSYSEYIKNIIDQNASIWERNIEECISSLLQRSEQLINTLYILYPENCDVKVFVPDTNEFIYHPDIEKWELGNRKALIVLLPIVIAELDNHKLNHRNEEVRKKADGIINRIKEYRRRGKLTDGVCILKEKIDLLCIAEEPNFDYLLSWMNKDNNDDRFIISALSVMRKFAHYDFTILTNDLNMQNKLEFMSLPYNEL